MNPKLTPIARIGDLITLQGYGKRVFRVDSYTHEFIYEIDATTEDIYYDCTCVSTSEYTIGAQDDVTVVCNEAQADAFLKTYKHPKFNARMPNVLENIFAEVKTVTKPVAKTKAVPTKQARIDALLDERNNVGSADDFVKVEFMEEFTLWRYEEIDAKIREVQAE